ncbi:MAG: OmpH family outer membrane protein [Pseudobdellovibrionaceae bacterium]|nr:OmpH family outer membrane protein [Bdellovibrionales bacterium]USN48898.1 MAG: OmpH family outer membrane protein [Pseudobdellovibrionaceae bacterium]
MMNPLSRLVVTCTLLMLPLSAIANTKIGYVDMKKAVESTKAGKSARETLEKEFAKKKTALEKRKADIEKMTQDFEKKSMVLSEDVRIKKQQSLQEEVLKYQKMLGESQVDISQKERDLMMPILGRLRDVIQDVAKEKGYTMVLEKAEQSVLWANEELDLTDEVIKRYDKGK